MSPTKAPFSFDNSYQKLPGHFYAGVSPTPVREPRLIQLNKDLCKELEIDPEFLAENGVPFFSGNEAPQGAAHIAQVYAGHQFGNFVPQLGDGRAILLGEVLDRHGLRRDIQLKGAGPTPFSRRGDGRAALGPVLREYLLSEAMHALGIPTTRALAAVSTGESVQREGAEQGAIFTRVAASHVRVGTFEYFSAREDEVSLKQLADYVIHRHYPECLASERPYLKLLERVAERQTLLVSRWMQVGFIHGVMNTDNMAVSGETIDYGPCAFLDHYNPDMVFSAIDRGGRYAFSNQPRIAQWNLARFAETLLPFLDPAPEEALRLAMEVITKMPEQAEEHRMAGLRAKFGLATTAPEDAALFEGFFKLLQESEADFTLSFRALCAAAANTQSEAAELQFFSPPEAFDPWVKQWRSRCEREPIHPAERAVAMRQVNPAVIPRNHRVAEAISAASQSGDFSVFERLLNTLKRPFEAPRDFPEAVAQPLPHERVLRTFCGT